MKNRWEKKKVIWNITKSKHFSHLFIQINFNNKDRKSRTSAPVEWENQKRMKNSENSWHAPRTEKKKCTCRASCVQHKLSLKSIMAYDGEVTEIEWCPSMIYVRDSTIEIHLRSKWFLNCTRLKVNQKWFFNASVRSSNTFRLTFIWLTVRQTWN